MTKNEKNDKKNINTPVEKIAYEEFVMMTAEQYESLLSRFGAEDTARLIALLNTHKGASGKTYKDDYYAILNWCVKALKTEKEAPAAKNDKRNRFINYTDKNADYSEVERQAIKKRRRVQPSSSSA